VPKRPLPAPEVAAVDDAEDLRSRSDTRLARREVEDGLFRLSRELVELSDRSLERLELPDPLFEVVRDTRAIKSPPARNRQLRLVRVELRNGDWGLVRARLDALNRHGAIPASLSAASNPGAARAREWVARLLGEGPEAIEALVRECPSADRTHLRSLIRLVEKASGDRRNKAELRLADAVTSLLRQPTQPS
jgi:ribosome-associated protein